MVSLGLNELTSGRPSYIFVAGLQVTQVHVSCPNLYPLSRIIYRDSGYTVVSGRNTTFFVLYQPIRDLGATFCADTAVVAAAPLSFF